MLNTVILPSRIAELVVARKDKVCYRCHSIVSIGEHYWRITVGKGLAAIKFPEKVCVLCFPEYAEKVRKEEKGRVLQPLD